MHTQLLHAAIARELHTSSSGKGIETVKAIAISVIKPLHAKWLVQVIAALKADPDVITKGFEKAGIASCFIS